MRAQHKYSLRPLFPFVKPLSRIVVHDTSLSVLPASKVPTYGGSKVGSVRPWTARPIGSVHLGARRRDAARRGAGGEGSINLVMRS